MSFKVLYVCTGNICRSPMGERMMLARLAPEADVAVASAGTHGLVGHPMDDNAAEVTRDYGADPDKHEGQRVTEALLADADLILTATGRHRDDVLRLAPRALRRTFTLREFVRLGRTLPAVPLTAAGGDLPARVAAVADQRGQVEPPAPGQDDIGDPFGGTYEQMQQCGSAVSSAVDSSLVVLGLAPQA